MLSHQVLDAADEKPANLIELTADIVRAHVSRNVVAVGDVAQLIAFVHGALSELSGPQPVAPEILTPAVSVRKSVQADHLVCLEDGKKFSTLKRHLQAEHGLSPDAYREKWGLPENYPMVAENYAAKRSKMARARGFGRVVKKLKR